MANLEGPAIGRGGELITIKSVFRINGSSVNKKNGKLSPKVVENKRYTNGLGIYIPTAVKSMSSFIASDSNGYYSLQLNFPVNGVTSIVVNFDDANSIVNSVSFYEFSQLYNVVTINGRDVAVRDKTEKTVYVALSSIINTETVILYNEKGDRSTYLVTKVVGGDSYITDYQDKAK